MNASVKGLAVPILATALVAGLWVFPKVWYTKSDTGLGHFWLSEQEQVEGWDFKSIPVSKAAEAVLVADSLFNGEFTSPAREEIRVFSAKRFQDSQNEIGLFVHTPDRCWTETGWKMEPTEPDSRSLTVNGLPMVLERRIFTMQQHRELVYFGGLVGGQPLPYRLDHNMSVGMRYAVSSGAREDGAGLRLSNSLFWQRVWESFRTRSRLAGPKQFVRISTPIVQNDVKAADDRLNRFLELWLKPVDFEEELRNRQEQRTTKNHGRLNEITGSP